MQDGVLDYLQTRQNLQLWWAQNEDTFPLFGQIVQTLHSSPSGKHPECEDFF